MNQRGKVQFSTVLFLLGLAIGGWAIFVYGPIYYDNMTVRQVTQSYLSRFTSPQTRQDLDLKALYINELNQIGQHEATDQFGNKKVVRGLGITPEMITMQHDQVQGIARVGVEYDRTFQLTPLKKWKTLHFSVFKEKAFSK